MPDDPAPTSTPQVDAPDVVFPDGWECEARCENVDCGKVKPHVIVRLNRKDKPRWCDQCHVREQPR